MNKNTHKHIYTDRQTHILMRFLWVFYVLCLAPPPLLLLLQSALLGIVCCYRTSCGSFVVCIVYACNKTLSSCSRFAACLPLSIYPFCILFLSTWFVSFIFIMILSYKWSLHASYPQLCIHSSCLAQICIVYLSRSSAISSATRIATAATTTPAATTTAISVTDSMSPIQCWRQSCKQTKACCLSENCQ